MLIETSRVRGQVTKRVTCEHCRCAYRYDVTRAARATSAAPLVMLLLAGPLLLVALRMPFTTLRIASRMGAGRGGRDSGGGGEMDAAANRRLRRELDRAVEPVACPACGWYQKDMVGEIRGRAMPWADWVALGLVVAAELAAVAGVAWEPVGPAQPAPRVRGRSRHRVVGDHRGGHGERRRGDGGAMAVVASP